MKRVSFKTLGCRLNQAETAGMKAVFRDRRFEIVPFGEPADVCVIHTCTITSAAEKECVRLGRSVKRRHADTFVVLAGCAPEVAGNSIMAACGADLAVGHADKYRIPDLIVEDPHPPATINRSPSTVPLFDTTRAWVKAQDGCSFKCAYCIVPAARGPSRSRPLSDVTGEVRALAEGGYREIVLTGANLGCYRDGSHKLVDLLSDIERIPGIRRIRLSSIEISTTEHEIVEYMASSEKLANSLHLPLQTGDDRLLKAMGRRYTSDDYRRLIDHILHRMPRAGIGSDFITGLPGEDERAFRNTLEMVNAIPYGNLHVFPYSVRPGTRAASMPGQVPRNVARERADTLIALGKVKQHDFANQFIGQEVEVLVENIRDNGAASGWTREYVKAHISQHNLQPNDIIRFTPSECSSAILS